MKKFICILTALLLVLSCLTGCNTNGSKDKDGDISADKDIINNPSDSNIKNMSIVNIANAVQKLSNDGMSVNIGLTLSFKPVFDEIFTKDMFDEMFGFIVNEKSDGAFEIPLTLKGEYSGENGTVDVLIKDKSVTDVILKDSKIYVNIKKVFNSVIEILTPAIGEGAAFVSWPYENEYADMSSLSGLMSDMSDSDMDSMFSTDDTGGLYDDTYGDMTEAGSIAPWIMDAADEIMASISDEKLNAFLAILQNDMENANVLTSDSNKIEIKLDKANIKQAFTALINTLRSCLPDIMDTVIPILRASENVPDDVKAALSDYDKAQLQQQIDDAYNEDEIKAAAEELEQAFGDGHIYVTLKADESSCEFIFDILITGLDTSSEDTSVTEAGIVFSVKCAEANVGSVNAPSNILTDAEIASLISAFSQDSE